MSRILRTISLIAVATAMLSAPAWAQPYTAETGFNDAPFDPLDWADYPDCMEMFRQPEWSGSTVTYVVPNTTGTYDQNYAVRTSGWQVEGDAAMEFNFEWVDPADPDAWVRMTTYLAPVLPNPSLHTGGKVTLSIIHLGNIMGGNGNVGMILCVRETGENVPLMANGGTSGELEFVGVNTTPNGIIAGPDGIVDTTAAGDDVQVYPVGYDIENDPNEPLPTGTAVILPGPNGVINTTPANDDEVRFGYFISDLGARRPIPAITLTPSPAPQTVVFDLATGKVSLNGGAYVGGMAPWTGNGTWEVTRGTLDAIGITNIATDTAAPIVTYIDVLEFEAPDPDPVLPPTIVAPIIKDDTSVTVTDLANDVEHVYLLKNGLALDDVAVSPAGSETEVVFTIAAAVTGDIYTAKQTGHGITSDESMGVTVLPEASPYSFALCIDEDGNNCTAGEWELVPVTDWPSGAAPLGAVMFNADATWQTIEIPLDDPYLITPWGGYGDGALDPNPDPNEDYYMIDSFWLSIANGAVNDGPHVMYMDSLVALDEFDNVIATIHDFEDGYNWVQNQRGQSTASSYSSTVTTTASYDGMRSTRMTWSYGSTAVNEYLIAYHAAGWTCGVSPTFPDSAAKLRVQLLCRSQDDPNDTVPLPVVTAPIIVGDQDTVQIQNHADALSVQLYINGEPEGSPLTPTGTTTDFAGLTLNVGDSISATQTLAAGESRPALPRGVIDVVPSPIVMAPIAPGSTSVQVTNLMVVPYASATLVEVYVNGGATPVGSVVPTSDTETVSLSITLVTGDVVTATQTVNTLVSPESDPVTVAYVAPVFYIAPPAGATTVRVQDLNENTDTVTITKNGSTQFTGTPVAGATYCDVPVSGLVAADTLTAYYTVAGVDSVESASETVTVSTTTVQFNDDMESYTDQDDFENASGEVRDTGWWGSSGDPCLTLDYGTGARNATPGGSQSAYCPAGQSPPQAGWTDGWQSNFDFKYPEPDWTPLAATVTDPLVWNVNVYDPGGAGTDNMYQWCELRDYTAGSLGSIIAVGMPGSSFFYYSAGLDNDYYSTRVYGGGPGYLNLNHAGMPKRSVGWHTFTVVVKDTKVDVYVDGVLGQKNVTRNSKLFDNLYMASGYA
ncbi:MAG: hypothetical protein JXO22_08940, partial [Phycisphaerae bacterium]|nr:hypothetical protein [Phycisphaerae bacterium]